MGIHPLQHQVGLKVDQGVAQLLIVGQAIAAIVSAHPQTILPSKDHVHTRKLQLLNFTLLTVTSALNVLVNKFSILKLVKDVHHWSVFIDKLMHNILVHQQLFQIFASQVLRDLAANTIGAILICLLTRLIDEMNRLFTEVDGTKQDHIALFVPPMAVELDQTPWKFLFEAFFGHQLERTASTEIRMNQLDPAISRIFKNTEKI